MVTLALLHPNQLSCYMLSMNLNSGPDKLVHLLCPTNALHFPNCIGSDLDLQYLHTHTISSRSLAIAQRKPAATEATIFKRGVQPGSALLYVYRPPDIQVECAFESNTIVIHAIQRKHLKNRINAMTISA